MRSITRAFFAVSLSTLAAACSIGEGNGIVSIRIVEIDATTDFEMRKDQCEGLNLAVLATFTDGQTENYTRRVEWSVESGDGEIQEILNEFGFVREARVTPVGSASIAPLVKATYLGLEATAQIVFNDQTITSIAPTRAYVDIFPSEVESFSSIVTTSNGALTTIPPEAMEYVIDESTSVVDLVVRTNNTVDVIANEATGTNTLRATFCSQNSALTQSYTVPVTVHSLDSNALSIEASTHTTVNGPSSADVFIPQGISTRVRTNLNFPNGNTREITEAAATSYSLQNTDTLSLDSDISAGQIVASTTNTGTNIVSISYQPEGMTNALADALNVTVTEADYATQDPYIIRDRQNNVIDITASPAVNIKSNAPHDLRLSATINNGSGGTYEYYFDGFDTASPKTNWSSDDSDAVAVEVQSVTFILSPLSINTQLNNILLTGSPAAETFPSNSNIAIDVSQLPNSAPAHNGFSATVHDNELTAATITAPSNGVSENSQIQLSAFMNFGDGGDDIYANGLANVVWSSSAPDVANVSNTRGESGLVRTREVSSDTDVNITVHITFLDKDNETTTVSETFTLSVTDSST